jgi:pimeloyl-ACP methyl ester carboxylesterase
VASTALTGGEMVVSAPQGGDPGGCFGGHVADARRTHAHNSNPLGKTLAVGHVDIGPMRMFYDEDGPPDTPTVVLLHGGMGVAGDPVFGWAGLAPSLAEHFHLVMPDHRGHGRTTNPAGWMTFEQLGDDLNALIEHLGQGAAHLAGISDGGVAVLDQALRRPQTVRSLVLVGTNYCVDDRTLGEVESIDADVLERDYPEFAAKFAALHDEGRHPGFWKDLIGQVIDNNRVSPTWTAADLERVQCPTLLIAGEDDPFANTEQMVVMKEAIPNAEWLIVNHAGHAVHSEHPDIVGPRMIDFLLRHSSVTGSA